MLRHRDQVVGEDAVGWKKLEILGIEVRIE